MTSRLGSEEECSFCGDTAPFSRAQHKTTMEPLSLSGAQKIRFNL